MRAAARQAGWLFLVASVIGIINDFVPGTVDHGQPGAIFLDALNGVVGIIVLRLPWERWSGRWTLLLPIAALANLSANFSYGWLPISTFGVWLVLVFVWIGQWHRPGMPTALAPVAAAAFGVPVLFGVSATSDVITGIALSVPVAALVGETIARKERASQEARSKLAAANLTDDLTGVGNRRQANVLLDSLEPGDALVMVDLDHFKVVNDTYGHLRGDELLQELGTYLTTAVRDADVVARFGGEEFLLVLRDAGPDGAVTVARLLDGWRDRKPLATLSAGMAVHRAGRSFHETFADTDAALYRAKETGRDRYVLAA